MINSNGNSSAQENSLTHNRGFLYGDAVFETLKIVNGKILFLEDHYFRLMASMRILRMEIPMDFTMEFLKTKYLLLLQIMVFPNRLARELQCIVMMVVFIYLQPIPFHF